MDYQLLGSTGMHVSTFCVGTMLLGAWGNRDHDEFVAVIHWSLDSGVFVGR